MLKHPYGATTEQERAQLADRLAKDLETLAEIIREWPEHIEQWWSLANHLTTYESPDGFKRFVTALKGDVHTDQSGGTRGWAKTFSDGTATVTGWIGTAIRIVLHTSREGVCERIVTGTKTVEEPDYTQAPVVTREVEEVEWKCQPFLAD